MFGLARWLLPALLLAPISELVPQRSWSNRNQGMVISPSSVITALIVCPVTC
jgi:hypothetical protein